MVDVGCVLLEVNGRTFELDLMGRTSRQVLAETRRLVHMMEQGQGPQWAVLPVRPADGEEVEDLFIDADLVKRGNVLVHSQDS